MSGSTIRMITETIAASFLLVCPAFFFSINLHNTLVVHRSSCSVRSYAEVDRPSGVAPGSAVLGTTAYFLKASFYPILVLTNSTSGLSVFNFGFPNTPMVCLLTLGLLLTAGGYSLFLWSTTSRGKYATSWEMRENHKLVTCGPYRYVRHPSYFANFIMFIGLFAIWPSWLTLIPLVCIPGYLLVSIQEEKLLERRFDQQYLEYRRRTGRFLPNIKRHRGKEESPS
jgi:protein-S-isoprenylcysteine O-methyltransferase Ste14